MKFVDSYFSKELRFSVGQEIESGRYYLSIPVSNRLVDYEEYYEIPKELHDAFLTNIEPLVKFAAQCRARQCDEWLMLKPGSDRGVPY